MKLHLRWTRQLFLLVVTLGFAAHAYAGVVVTATGKDLESAMDAARVAVEEAAKSANRCVSEYPRAEKCRQLSNGDWECSGVRAKHKGSCK